MGNNGKKNYLSQEERLEILKVLEANDMDMKKTLDILDHPISLQTLRTWKDKYGPMIFLRNKVAVQNAEIITNYRDTQEAFLNRVGEVKLDFLEKLKDMLDSETNMKNISEALKVLHLLGTDSMPTDPEKAGGGLTLVQQITNKMLKHETHNHGTEKN